MDDRLTVLLRVLIDAGRPLILTKFERTSCLASTRVAVDYLAAFGYTARPLSVEAMLWNRAALAVYERTGSWDEVARIARTYTVEQPGGPWSVGIGHGDGVGHVVAWLPTERLFVDLSLDQASRPQKGLATEPVVVNVADVPDWPDTPAGVGFPIGEGGRIHYRPDARGRKPWAGSRDYTLDSRTERITGSLIRSARATLRALPAYAAERGGPT